MRTTLISLAVLSVISTGVLAQNFPTSFGNSSVTITNVGPVASTGTGTVGAPDRGFAPGQLRQQRVRVKSHR